MADRTRTRLGAKMGEIHCDPEDDRRVEYRMADRTRREAKKWAEALRSG